MTLAVLTPFHGSQAVELGNRMWRKKILPVGDVEYKGRILKFTRDYLGRLVNAYNARAYDQVPFQLADAANTHTNDPERTRGEITGMELGDDGLYVTAKVNEAGEQVLTANPKLGVSARIVEDYARSDGQRFPAAIQHVLGTLDPRIPGLGAWTAIEAANPVADQVVDLSASSFAGEELTPDGGSSPDPTQQEDRTDMADFGNLTDEQKQRLVKLLDLPDDQLDQLANGGVVLTPEELDALTTPDTEDEPDDDLAAEIDGMSDEEIAALEAEYEAQNAAPEREPVTAGLSAEAQFEIDLANARADENAREVAVISARLREEDFRAEQRRYADLGVPPYITELARPLLEGAGHAVELANGNTVDAGQIMRKVLAEYGRQVKLLDLGAELGSPMDEPEDSGALEQATSREELVSRFKSVTGLK
jgi:hypothetical protein